MSCWGEKKKKDLSLEFLQVVIIPHWQLPVKLWTDYCSVLQSLAPALSQCKLWLLSYPLQKKIQYLH